MTAYSQSQADIITPAEAKFWADWAAKVPAQIRSEVRDKGERANTQIGIYKIGGITLGTALGIATFSKYVPNKWKLLSGISAAATLAGGLLMGGLQGNFGNVKQGFFDYADSIERDSALKQQLADHFSKTITADHIQQFGIDQAVLGAAVEFGMQRPYLRPPVMPQGGRPQTAPQGRAVR